MSFSSDDEAISRANASDWGLGGSVWSTDLERAYNVADQMESGTVWVNKHAELDPTIPFGGAKQSGLGTELGQQGFEEFTQRKVINLAKRV